MASDAWWCLAIVKNFAGTFNSCNVNKKDGIRFERVKKRSCNAHIYSDTMCVTFWILYHTSPIHTAETSDRKLKSAHLPQVRTNFLTFIQHVRCATRGLARVVVRNNNDCIFVYSIMISSNYRTRKLSLKTRLLSDIEVTKVVIVRIRRTNINNEIVHKNSWHYNVITKVKVKR